MEKLKYQLIEAINNGLQKVLNEKYGMLSEVEDIYNQLLEMDKNMQYTLVDSSYREQANISYYENGYFCFNDFCSIGPYKKIKLFNLKYTYNNKVYELHFYDVYCDYAAPGMMDQLTDNVYVICAPLTCITNIQVASQPGYEEICIGPTGQPLTDEEKYQASIRFPYATCYHEIRHFIDCISGHANFKEKTLFYDITFTDCFNNLQNIGSDNYGWIWLFFYYLEKSEVNARINEVAPMIRSINQDAARLKYKDAAYQIILHCIKKYISSSNIIHDDTIYSGNIKKDAFFYDKCWFNIGRSGYFTIFTNYNDYKNILRKIFMIFLKNKRERKNSAYLLLYTFCKYYDMLTYFEKIDKMYNLNKISTFMKLYQQFFENILVKKGKAQLFQYLKNYKKIVTEELSGIIDNSYKVKSVDEYKYIKEITSCFISPYNDISWVDTSLIENKI